MLESILSAAVSSGDVTIQNFVLCTVASLILGIGAAFLYMFKNEYSKNFVITLALLPAIVQIIIMLVNGNLGTGLAVMGTFSLVRFRSIPGSAKEIGSIFLAMAIGLATGMGYLFIALLFLLMIGAMSVVLNVTSFGQQKKPEKELKITIPENLDYSGIFDDLFAKYTKAAELVRVKTTNMGSLYELNYHITLTDEKAEKDFIDELRCRNGNLNITCGRMTNSREEL